MGLRFHLDDGQEFSLDARQVAQIRMDGPPRRIDIPEARRFADLRSVWGDLDIAIAALNRLIAIRESPDRDVDGVLEHSYWLTAVIHYMRCFTEGKRKTGLSHNLIERRLPKYAALHKWVWNMRNKHVAHDENPYQQFLGSLVIHRSPDGTSLVSPNVAARWIIAVDAARARAMKDLMVQVGEIVNGRIAKAQKDFTEAIAKLPLSEIEALPAVELPVPSMEDAGRNRNEG